MKARRERPEVFTSLPSAAITPSDMRTFAVVGHRSSGKTSLCELILQAGRVVREQGSVKEGTALLDWSPLERQHRQTLELSAAWIEYNGGLLQLLDTPGAPFLTEIRDLGICAADSALLVVDSSEGVQIGTEEAMRSTARFGVPTIAVVTKWKALTGTFASFADLVQEISACSGILAIPLHLPFEDEAGLVGLIDVMEDRVLRYDAQGAGAFSPEPVPTFLRASVDRAREALMEAIASTSDHLLEYYLENFSLPPEEIRAALAAAVHQRKFIPVLIAEANRRIGALALLDAIWQLTPPYGVVERRLIEQDGTEIPLDPNGPFVAQVLSEHRDERGEHWHLLRVLAGTPPKGDWFDGRYGTAHRIRKLYRVRGPRRASAPALVPGLLVATWDLLDVVAGTTLTDGAAWEISMNSPRPPMFALSIRPTQRKDEARLNDALQAVIRADRGLALLSDTTSGTLLLAGADEAHVRIAIERIREWSEGMKVLTELPPVGYVEMPAATVQGIEGLHVQKGSDGLVEEYGKCEVAIEPTSPEDGTRFVDAIVDDEDLPIRYRGAIDEGARLAMLHGPTAGYPVVGVELHLTGGAYDILQSTDDHFRLAGERAARNALEKVGTRVLEPWWEIEIVSPQQAVGDLISDVTSHRGRILGVEIVVDTAYITAHVPYRELRTFGGRVQTLTGGRGHFQTAISHYEPLPDHLLKEAIDASPHRSVRMGR